MRHRHRWRGAHEVPGLWPIHHEIAAGQSFAPHSLSVRALDIEQGHLANTSVTRFLDSRHLNIVNYDSTFLSNVRVPDGCRLIIEVDYPRVWDTPVGDIGPTKLGGGNKAVLSVGQTEIVSTRHNAAMKRNTSAIFPHRMRRERRPTTMNRSRTECDPSGCPYSIRPPNPSILFVTSPPPVMKDHRPPWLCRMPRPSPICIDPFAVLTIRLPRRLRLGDLRLPIILTIGADPVTVTLQLLLKRSWFVTCRCRFDHGLRLTGWWRFELRNRGGRGSDSGFNSSIVKHNLVNYVFRSAETSEIIHVLVRCVELLVRSPYNHEQAILGHPSA